MKAQTIKNLPLVNGKLEIIEDWDEDNQEPVLVVLWNRMIEGLVYLKGLTEEQIMLEVLHIVELALGLRKKTREAARRWE